MSDTNNGWPGKPGVPLNPEKDGWHWLRSSNGELIAVKYFAANKNGWPEWPTWIGGQSPESARTARFHAYIGPCLTPDGTAALIARIAKLKAALRNIEADCCSDCPPSHGAIKYACRDALGGGKDE